MQRFDPGRADLPEATLTANFFGARDAGAVSGEIGSFRDGSGRAMAGWRVTLSLAMLSAGEADFAGATGGTAGSGSSGAGSWQGRFHGTDDAATNARRVHATGPFALPLPGRPHRWRVRRKSAALAARNRIRKMI